MVADYIPQIQMQMMVCELNWSEFMSYSPYHEPLIVRVMADDDYMKKLDNLLEEFLSQLEELKTGLAKRGIVPQ